MPIPGPWEPAGRVGGDAPVRTTRELDKLLKSLGRVEIVFRDVEAAYFQGRASVEELRNAWNNREHARLKVAEVRVMAHA